MIIAGDDHDQRIDRWLRKNYPDLGFGQIQKLLRTGQIRMDGKRVKADTRLIEGADLRLPPQITMALSKEEPRKANPAHDRAFIQALVLHDDAQILAIDKPAGLAVQGGSGITRHVDGLLESMLNENGVKPRLVHRLDRETSGVLLLARTAESARKLGDAFAGRDVEKTYLAITTPAPKQDKGRIDAALAKGMTGTNFEKMLTDDETGKTAITDYEVVARAADGKAALVAFKPLTGRMHQIRVHAALIGCPLMGDKKYGGAKGPRLFLHAAALELEHPKTREALKIEAPLPEAFDTALKKLGIRGY